MNREDDNILDQLTERDKELRCIYAICDIACDLDGPLDQIMQRIVDSVPQGFLHPELTCASVRIGTQVTKTANFDKCRWTLEKEITTNDQIVGKLEVGYLGTAADDNPPSSQRKRISYAR